MQASPVGDERGARVSDPFVRRSLLSRKAVEPWLRGALLGAVLGTLLLGIGGRGAMRAIAAVQNAPTGFSVGGTMTIVFLGAVSGVVAGLIYSACRRVLPRHVSWARALFAAILLAITLRGLRPLDTSPLIIFLPLFVAFGFALDRLWNSAVSPGKGVRHR